MIFPLKRNFRDKISQDFSRGTCEGPKFSRLKFSRPDKNPRKFLPSKILGYTVLYVRHVYLISNDVIVSIYDVIVTIKYCMLYCMTTCIEGQEIHL